MSVLLKLCNKLVTLAHYILVLLILIVGPVRLDYTLATDAVNCAWDTAGSNEASEVTCDEWLVDEYLGGFAKMLLTDRESLL